MKYIKNNKISITLVILIAIFSLSSCSKFGISTNNNSEVVSESEKVIKPLSVNAARVILGEIDSSINVGGSVSSGTPVAIIGEASGTLKEFTLEVGDKVQKDQVVAKIDPSRPGMVYKMKDVKAPISGTIVRVGVENGSLSSPSVPLAYIDNLDNSSLKVRIIEKYIPQIKIGGRVELIFEAFSNEVFEGNISKIDPTVDISTRTIGLSINFEDSQNKILPGMFAKCRIITEYEANALLIPSTSVFYENNNAYVYKIIDDTIYKTSIQKGIESYEYVQVTDGLSKDDLVVNTKSSLLGDGIKVVIKNQGAY